MEDANTEILVRGILIKEGKVLLLRRTIDKGGGYNLVGGRVERYESPAQGLIREIREEIGVTVYQEHTELIRVVYREKRSSTPKLHLVFWVSEWHGEPSNMEPNKCLGLKWCELDQLPPDLATVAGIVLRAGQDDPFYIEAKGKYL